MVKRALYIVVALSLLLVAVEGTAAATSPVGPGAHDHTASIVARESTMLTPLARVSRTRHVGSLGSTLVTILVAVVDALFLGGAGRIRSRRAREMFAISRRGPPVLLAVS